MSEQVSNSCELCNQPHGSHSDECPNNPKNKKKILALTDRGAGSQPYVGHRKSRTW